MRAAAATTVASRSRPWRPGRLDAGGFPGRSGVRGGSRPGCVVGWSQPFARGGEGGFPPLVEAVVEECEGFVYARVDPTRIETHGVFYPKAYAFARRMEDDGHVFPAVKVRPSDPSAQTPLCTPRLHARDGAHRVMAARLLHRTILVRMKRSRGGDAGSGGDDGDE